MKIWNGTYSVMYDGTDVEIMMYVEVDVLNARRRFVELLFENFYHFVAGSYRKICKNWLQRHTHTSLIKHFLESFLAHYSKGHTEHKTHVSVFLCLASANWNFYAKVPLKQDATGTYRNCPTTRISGVNRSGNQPFAFWWLPNLCPIFLCKRCTKNVVVLSLNIHLCTLI